MVPLDGCLCETQLLLHNVGFDAQIGELISQSLRLYAQCLALLLANLEFFLEQDGALD